MDTASLAVGGDWIKGDGTAGKCPVGEESSDAVSQLHKVSGLVDPIPVDGC